MVYRPRLGMTGSTADRQLMRLLLYGFAKKLDLLDCFRCGLPISQETFSIDHKTEWGLAVDPRSTFFDTSNIAFSHAKCNAQAGAGLGSAIKTHCPQEHPYNEENTVYERNGARKCRTCKRARDRR